jgi:hypothetical protein
MTRDHDAAKRAKARAMRRAAARKADLAMPRTRASTYVDRRREASRRGARRGQWERDA